MLHTGFEKSFRFLLLITFFSCFYPEVWPKYFSVCDACMKFLSPHFPFCLRLAGSGSNCLKFMSLCTKQSQLTVCRSRLLHDLANGHLPRGSPRGRRRLHRHLPAGKIAVGGALAAPPPVCRPPKELGSGPGEPSTAAAVAAGSPARSSRSAKRQVVVDEFD